VDDHRLKEPPTPIVVPALDADVPPAVTIPISRLLDPRRPTWQLVLTLAWPTLLQQLLVFAVNLFDGLMAGRFQNVSSDEQIASQAVQTTANYLPWFLTSYTLLVSIGGTALVARLLAAGDRRGAVHAANQAILLAVVLGVCGGTLGYFGLPSLVTALQLRGAEAELAATFLRPMFVLLAFQMVEAVGVACLVGAGDTRTGMVVLGGVAVVNMPLTWLFFAGLGPLPGPPSPTHSAAWRCWPC
jgi:MATE family, multidrug efflux pump